MSDIVVLDPGYPSYTYEEQLFGDQGYHLIISRECERDLKIAHAKEAKGVLVRGTLLDAAALDRMPHLMAIVRYGTGYENIDIRHAARRGIRVANVQGYASDSVSDHAIGLMYSCIRGIGHRWSGEFGAPFRREVFELHNKTLGIIGFGRIGSRMSRKAGPLFSRILACDPYQDSQQINASGAIKSDRGEVLRESDVISVHCNLTRETHHLLDGKAFRSMERCPVILNTARGAVVDSRALLEALESNRIHSAGLDVYEHEPPGSEEQKLIAHPRVIATPHVAWYSDTAQAELQTRAADNLLALLRGERIPDEITPQNI
jgi:D-3-phosphoglycerate dehydrogenase